MPETYQIEILHEGKTHRFPVSEEQTILKVANEEEGLDLPCSCHSGVCTTCAAQIIGEGTVDQTDGMGVSQELQKEGYVLLCVAYPRSNLKIETCKEEIVYKRQFGKD